MKDELDDDKDAALIIGVGPPKDELGGGGDLEPLMQAFARALKTGNFGKAARLFEEAVNVCDDAAGDDDEEQSPFKGRGSDDDDDGDFLS